MRQTSAVGLATLESVVRLVFSAVNVTSEDIRRSPTAVVLCLTPSGPNPTSSELYSSPNYAGPPISKVLLRTCDGSQWQKWNAPPYLTEPPPITDFVER